MKKETVIFAETVNRGEISCIGKSVLNTPATQNKSGGGIKWFPDTYKSDRK
ncbi:MULTISPECIES: hypothetical protein [Robinsoniella]|uniref:hypothetical protein n=1 Tax=Robinsoniella TaxID=588605 RepID=UPI0012DFC274|nr:MULTISPECIES: hypothetical protein [Robinsoniella]